jgi:hypothetical protein
MLGWLELKPSSLNLTGLDGNSPGPGGITFISRRQTHTLFTYSLVFDFEPKMGGEEAGISLFLSQNHHARVGITALPLAPTYQKKLHHLPISRSSAEFVMRFVDRA